MTGRDHAAGTTPTSRSGVGEDLLGAGLVDPVDEAFAAERAVGRDDVLGGAGGELAVSAGLGRPPLDDEAVAGQGPGADLDRSGHEPLDGVAVAVERDRDGAGVLGPGGVDAVDDVGSGDALTVGSLVETVAGEAAHRQPAPAQRDEDHDRNGVATNESGDAGRHGEDGTDEWRLPRWAKVTTAVFLLVAAAGMAFAVFQPLQVLPRIRLAPGYAMVDHTGAMVTSEDGRGAITLVTFVPLDCDEDCDRVNDTMSEVRERVERDVDLDGTPFRLLTIVLDDDPDPGVVAAARERAGADWTWASGDAAQVENVVGLGFRRSTDPAAYSPSYAIVDGWGMIRGEYRYQTIADDAEKLTRHLDVLGGELRNDGGFASFAYDAAHAFQCYP